MEKLEKITVGDKAYPVKIDLNVLEIIQEEYGTINGFEKDILGVRYVKDEDGNQIYDEHKKPKIEILEPSVRAIKLALPAMINEGLSIEADETGSSFVPVTEAQVFRECTIDYEVLAGLIHKEFKKCFVTKK